MRYLKRNKHLSLLLVITLLCVLSVTLLTVTASQETLAPPTWDPDNKFFTALIAAVPAILSSQDPETGRFGTEPWICTDQNIIFPLAAAWSIDDPDNPFYHDSELLDAIIRGGNALVDAQDEDGAWTFRKKDGSTWGQILMPWTYSSWVRAFYIIKDAMPAEQRKQWEEGLLRGFNTISKHRLGRSHNMTAHLATALYCAGLCFDRSDWREQARGFISKITAAQNEHGWWSENSGPVVIYNFEYTDALGVYYALSRDSSVLEPLRRAALFHRSFTYPDGTSIETVDERNYYRPDIQTGTVGFTFSAEGRGYLQRQFELKKWKISPHSAATFLLYGETGPTVPLIANASEMTVLGNNDALILNERPWFVVMSAFEAPPSDNRWIQDRQNFVSIYHEDAGLIVGGGNTKLQPFWSNFTFGDPTSFKHVEGDEDPDFEPPDQLSYLPSSITLRPAQKAPALHLVYGDKGGVITVVPLDKDRLKLYYELVESNRSSDIMLNMEASVGPDRSPVEGHIVFVPRLKETLRTSAGMNTTFDEAEINLNSDAIGTWFDIGVIRVHVPEGASLSWPKKAHNPYKKDGSSTLGDARLVLSLPLSANKPWQEVTLEVRK